MLNVSNATTMRLHDAVNSAMPLHKQHPLLGLLHDMRYYPRTYFAAFPEDLLGMLRQYGVSNQHYAIIQQLRNERAAIPAYWPERVYDRIIQLVGGPRPYLNPLRCNYPTLNELGPRAERAMFYHAPKNSPWQYPNDPAARSIYFALVTRCKHRNISRKLIMFDYNEPIDICSYLKHTERKYIRYIGAGIVERQSKYGGREYIDYATGIRYDKHFLKVGAVGVFDTPIAPPDAQWMFNHVPLHCQWTIQRTSIRSATRPSVTFYTLRNLRSGAVIPVQYEPMFDELFRGM